MSESDHLYFPKKPPPNCSHPPMRTALPWPHNTWNSTLKP